ncbi:NAD(P)/FAD-dependent oxidoreductase [Massilia sp. LjRoot122]|uniref:NAD(P)/FAD-dependent oxidoreductase n=1 Tax=Massilia sp. LjRoot122 TaxID=3342257 RepID=UPI003ECE4D38
MSTTQFDAIVIGGSYAGLSAALQLARAWRQVLVVGAGQRRNRFASESHGFLGRDSQMAAAIAQAGRADVAAYPNVQWIDGSALDARAEGEGFVVELDGAAPVQGRRLVLATGVRDELPPVAGLAERWGRSVFHCPYCHGYELQQGAIGIIASGEMAFHQAMLLPDWGKVTLFTDGRYAPDEEQRAAMEKRGVIAIDDTPILRIEDVATVVLADGRRLPHAGLFTYGRIHMSSPIAERLGCAFDDGPLGPFIRTDMGKQTTVPGVFAGGDATRAAGNVAIAVADGAMAGLGAHRSLVFG